MEILRKADFQQLDDKVFNFKYWKKVAYNYLQRHLLFIFQAISEKDKNHPEGTNIEEAGVIPYQQFGSINPGELFGMYMEYLPDQGTLPGRGGYLFPKPRDLGRSFNIHAAGESNFYQPNQPGIET